MEKKQKYFLAAVGVVAGCMCLVNSYIGHWKDVEQKTPEYFTPAVMEYPEVPDYKEEKEQHQLLFSAPLGPETELQIYDNFTLYVEGTGASWDFASREELLEHLAQYGKGTEAVFEVVSPEENLSEEVVPHGMAERKKKLSVPEISELASMVKEIVVEDGMEYLGSYVLSLYPAVSEVALPGSVALLSGYTFQGLGSAVKEATVWNGTNPLQIEHEETTFEDAAGIIELTAAEREARQYLQSMEELQEGLSEEHLVCWVPVGDVTYELYDTGVLYLTGNGSTGDYKNESTVMKLMMRELGLRSIRELDELWYSKVTAIYIGGGVTRIGDWALSRYASADTVFFEQMPESFGKYAFCRLGSATEGKVNWNSFTLAEDMVTYEDITFQYVKNPPEQSGKAKEETE